MNNLPKSRISELKDCLSQWCGDYDPEEEALQHNMFSDAMVAMDMLLSGMERKPSGYLYRAHHHQVETPWRYAKSLPDYVVGDGWEVRQQFEHSVLVVSEHQEYPEKLPCQVSFEPGPKFHKGVNTSAMLGALQRRVEYQAEIDAMTPEQRAEHDVGVDGLKSLFGKPAVSEQPASVVVPDEKLSDIDSDDYPLLWSYNNGWNACRTAMLTAAPQAPVSDGWIKCSDRLPEENGPVLVHQEGGIIFCAEYEEDDGFCPDEFPNVPKQGREITYWMPLPNPPTPEA